jgi:hypothetical protein
MPHSSPVQTTIPARKRGPDRRLGLRFTLAVKADARFGRAEHASPIWIVNVSRQGVGLLSAEHVRIGTTVEVRLRASRANHLHAAVLHCTPQGEGEWYLGCLLTDGTAVDPALLGAGKIKRPRGNIGHVA